MRIAIDGAQSTGKTTLLNQLRTSSLTFPFKFISEASRSIAHEFDVSTADDWPALLRDPDKLELFFHREEEWLTKEESHGPFVVDSSHLLIRAYRRSFLPIAESSLEAPVNYDLVLYCPLNAVVTVDGFRFLEGQQTVDQTYRAAVSLQTTGRFVELPIGETRLNEAIAAINSLITSGQ